MVERLQDMRPGTLGFRATGAITRDDFVDVLVPELRSALESGEKLRTLYVIEAVDQVDPRALWEDVKLDFDLGVRHHDAWERSAIVTDIDWIAQTTKLFAWVVPGEARVFPIAELEQAKAWVAGGES